jgi:ABC-type antimicrobial peptide transport system permease subunit
VVGKQGNGLYPVLFCGSVLLHYELCVLAVISIQLGVLGLGAGFASQATGAMVHECLPLFYVCKD